MAWKPNRRWFRFTIRAAMLVIAVAAAWLAYHANWKRDRANAFVEWVASSRRGESDVPMPFGLRLTAAQSHRYIYFRRGCSYVEFHRLEKLFPEAEILGWVDGCPVVSRPEDR